MVTATENMKAEGTTVENMDPADFEQNSLHAGGKEARFLTAH